MENDQTVRVKTNRFSDPTTFFAVPFRPEMSSEIHLGRKQLRAAVASNASRRRPRPMRRVQRKRTGLSPCAHRKKDTREFDTCAGISHRGTLISISHVDKLPQCLLQKKKNPGGTHAYPSNASSISRNRKSEKTVRQRDVVRVITSPSTNCSIASE